MESYVIRLKDAPAFVGVKPSTFDVNFRPKLTRIQLGNRSVGFYRHEIINLLDTMEVAEGASSIAEGGRKCQTSTKGKRRRMGVSSRATAGTSGGKMNSDLTVESLAELAISRKQKHS